MKRKTIAPPTRGERVIAFIERYIRVPEGKHVGKPLKLELFQKRFILAVYDNPVGTSRAYLSIARKNGKSALIAAIMLAHLIGPEARQNSQIVSGARSREQAGIVFKLAVKMVQLNPDLKGLTHVTPSQKTMTGLVMNVEYRAISAEAGTAHGLSPVLAILDEVGQVKGPTDAFIEAIETAQGAHDDPLLIAISTQASADGDMFSMWLDDAKASGDPRIVSHVYAAPDNCELNDREAWKAANPGLGTIRTVKDMEDWCERAMRQPSQQNSFRWLYLNQRIDASAPFISKDAWQVCGDEPDIRPGDDVWLGLDLSSVSDLTALVMISRRDEVWQVVPTFWLPLEGLKEKSRTDRVPYEEWRSGGFLEAAPGRTVDYDFVAAKLVDVWRTYNVRAAAFDDWGWQHLKPKLVEAGFTDDMLGVFVNFRQGFKSMSPALRALEAEILNGRLAHGNHPVLAFNARNATVVGDAAGNRKLTKAGRDGKIDPVRRIDGMVALTMAMGVAPMESDAAPVSDGFFL